MKRNGKNINCKICGKEFYIKRIRYKTAKFCSYKCAGIGKRGIIPKMAFKKRDIRISGKNNWQWKGEKVSYIGLHQWVKKYLGKPMKCQNCGKTFVDRKIHWANKSGLYKRDLKDWIRLCVSCHKKHDNWKEKVINTWRLKYA